MNNDINIIKKTKSEIRKTNIPSIIRFIILRNAENVSDGYIKKRMNEISWFVDRHMKKSTLGKMLEDLI